MKRALVTGSLGFVGRYMERALEQRGWNVTGVDISQPIVRDARDFFRHNDRSFDLVVHLAAVVGGRKTIELAPLDVAVDLAIDAELFQWALRTRPGKVVYFSSSAAYPIELQRRELHRPLEEADIDLRDVRQPDAIYGWVKLTGEMLAVQALKKGVNTLVVRPFSGYAEDQSLDYPFPSLVKRVKERAKPFDIWGDGEQVRDFIHMTDVVEGTLALVEADAIGPVNLGTGRPTSFNDLARMMCSEDEFYSPEFRHLVHAPVGVDWRVANTEKMSEYYTPKVSLEEGVRKALDAD